MALINTEFESSYQIRYYISALDLEGVFAIRQVIASPPFEGNIGIAPVVREFEGVIANGIKFEVTGLHGYSYSIANELEGVYRLRDTIDVSKEFESVSSSTGLSNEVTGTYSIAESIFAEFESVSQMVSSVSKEFEGIVKILDFNPVAKEFTSVQQYSGALGGAIINSATPPFVSFSGIQLGIIEADVSHDEDGYLWEASIKLGSISDYAKIVQDETFILDIYGEQYNLIVDSKELNRSAPAVMTSSLVGLSPTALLDFPRADPYTKTWDTPVYASVAAAHAVGNIQWNLVDWEIPPYRLVFEDVAPIEVASQLAEVAGGTIETLPDGSLIARHLYPVSVPNYGAATPDHVLTEVGDIRQLTEQFVPSKLINRLLITDNENLDFADKIEFEVDENDPAQGTLRVFLSPWRDEFYLQSSNTAISLTPGFIVTETWPLADDPAELVEIFDGQGNVAYPIWGIVDVNYESFDVSPLTWTEGSDSITTSTEANKYGLFYLRYLRKYYQYTIYTSDLPAAAQIILVDTSEDL